MKTNRLIALLMIIFIGCSKPEPAPLTPQEQEVVKKESRDILNLQIRACEKADVDALLQAGLDSPDVIAFMTDGTMLDYQGAKKATAEIFKPLVSAKFTTVKDDFRFLSSNLVLYAWLGKCEMTLKLEIWKKSHKFVNASSIPCGYCRSKPHCILPKVSGSRPFPRTNG